MNSVKQLGSAILLSMTIFVSSAMAAEPPSDMIDFDRQVSFSKPLLMTVYRSYGDPHTYFVMPNTAKIDTLSNQAPDATLLYQRAPSGGRALVTVRGTVAFANDYAAAIEEIRSADPQARFVVPEPAQFAFKVFTPGTNGDGATVETAQIDGVGHFEILASVADIAARILLIPESYKFDLMAISYAPSYRGVQRSEDGTVGIVQRTYNISVVGNGGCALSPERYVSWTTTAPGCQYPRYSAKMIKPIQARLKALTYYRGSVDGVYGPLTNRAIRLYQRYKGLPEDGIPTLDLLEQLQS